MESIRIRGARTHNLKNVSLDLPRNRLVVITGLSGSGKSSLAFDTLYAEGQRRYVESLSAYARQFLQLMEKPDVDLIEGLSPAIAIEQKATSHNPRSTVGTVTEIHDYLRLLFARVGDPYCPEHDIALSAQSVAQMVDHVLALPEDTRADDPRAARGRAARASRPSCFEELRAQGFVRAAHRRQGARDRRSCRSSTKNTKHTVEVVVDRLKRRGAGRQAAPGRIVRDRAAPRRRPRDRGGDGQRQGAPLLGEVRLPDLQLLAPRARAAPVLVQQPDGRLPALRRPGRRSSSSIRSASSPSRTCRSPAARSAAGTGATSSTSRCCSRSRSTTASTSRRRSRRCRERVAGASCCTARARRRSPSAIPASAAAAPVKEHAFEGVIPNLERRYRETDSVVVREELAKYLNTRACPECGGTRLRREARHVSVAEQHDPRALGAAAAAVAADFFETLELDRREAGRSPRRIVREIANRAASSWSTSASTTSRSTRSADTLSGGEAQRIRLASQIGSGLTGVMYVLDEPSIGLHQRDNARLIETLKRLRDLGNTVIVVEHDEEAIRAADYVVDMGPGAGVHGGEIVAAGHARARSCAIPTRSPASTSPARAAIAVPRAAPPARPEAACAIARRARQQPEERRRSSCRVGPVRLRHRRLGLGQVHADQRHALRRGRAPPLRLAGRARAARRDRGPGASSTRWSASTRARSAARRAPTRRPTPACSRRSASSSPACPRRARAATAPGASRSTSRAGAARPARATA